MIDTLKLSTWRPLASGFATGLAITVPIVAFGYLLAWVPGYQEAGRRLCDRAVDALVRSNDLVEVQRAGIIIHELDCSIRRRLTENEK